VPEVGTQYTTLCKPVCVCVCVCEQGLYTGAKILNNL